MKIVSIFLILISLSGCEAFGLLPSLGGGTSSKGHGNDNTLMVGSDVQQGVGNSQLTQEVESNHGEISTNKTQQQADNINNNTGLSVWQILLLAFGGSVVFLFVGFMLPQFDFMRKMSDGK